MALTYYRSGQAAKLLGVSGYLMRRLCESGLVEAELTDANQWRIPGKEVERLQRDGVPEAPAAVPEPSRPTAPDTVTPKPIAAIEPNDAPEVRQEKNAVAIARNRLERRKLELEEETVNDAFRERENIKEREAAAVEERKRQAEEEEVRQLQASAAASRRRRWEEEHIGNALRMIPFGVIGELRLNVEAEVRAVLQRREPDDDGRVTDRLVEAARDKALFPHRRSRIASDASKALPYGMQDGEMGGKAKSAAAAVLENMASTSTDEEMKEAAGKAVEPIVQAARHELNIRDELKRLEHLAFFKVPESDRQKTKAAGRKALGTLPTGATVQAMRKALKPIEDDIGELHERQQLRQRTDEIAGRAESLLLSALAEHYEYEDYSGKRDHARELKSQLEPLLRRAVMRGELDAGGAAAFVESWLSDLVAEDAGEDEE